MAGENRKRGTAAGRAGHRGADTEDVAIEYAGHLGIECDGDMGAARKGG